MTASAVRLERVSKAFDGRAVLSEVSFEVPAGRTLCILGRSGTGKSVTLKHMIGLVRPDAGRVFVQGDEITALDAPGLARVRRRMGFLFQNAALFDSLTVGGNVEFPLRRHTKLTAAEMRDRAMARLRAVGLEDAYPKMPGELSGGMRKRAGLARAMVLDPDILLVDEPSAGLDPLTSQEIDELLLAEKQGGTTLVVVTHNIPSARTLADELVVLDRGRVVAQGTAAALEGHDDPLVQGLLAGHGGG